MSGQDRRDRQRAWERFIQETDAAREPWPPDNLDAVQRLRVLWEFSDELADDDYRNAGYVRREPPTATDKPARGPGRPGWTRETFWEHYDAAQAIAPEPKTQALIAAKFVALDGAVGVDPGYLRQLRRDPRLRR